MEVGDESSFGAYYQYLAVAGELNPITVLGISPVVGLTMEDVNIAYNRALRHVQKQRSPSLPPTRWPRDPNSQSSYKSVGGSGSDTSRSL